MARPAALILSGGIALGAYQAGVLAAFQRSGTLDIRAIAGSSIGAINGAIFAGTKAHEREQTLRAFWRSMAHGPDMAGWLDPFGWTASGPVRHLRNWGSVIAARIGGARGMFHAAPIMPALGGASLYDNRESVATLRAFIDFDRLAGGNPRLCVVATDIENGETVVFDTAAGDRLSPEHLRASSGLLPLFEPVRISRRLLGDGGLSANAPLEPFLASGRREDVPPLCILIDLFAPDGPAPSGLMAATERSNDLKYACQTLLRLEAIRREHVLAARLDPGAPGIDLVYLSYRSRPDEAGPEKTWDFSQATLADRFRAGEADAAAALATIAGLEPDPPPGFRIHRVRAEAG